MKDITLYITEKLVIDKEVKAGPEYKPGTLVKVYSKNSKTNGKGGLMDRTLEIYKRTKGFQGKLWNSGFSGWKGGRRKPMEVYKADTVDEILKYFNFNETFENK